MGIPLCSLTVATSYLAIYRAGCQNIEPFFEIITSLPILLRHCVRNAVYTVDCREDSRCDIISMVWLVYRYCRWRLRYRAGKTLQQAYTMRTDNWRTHQRMIKTFEYGSVPGIMNYGVTCNGCDASLPISEYNTKQIF